MDSNFTLKEMQRMDAGLAPWESMSFACGGWLQFYMFGVGKALQEAGMDRGVTYAGCSAGALTAVGLALGGNFDDAFEGAKSCIPTAYGSARGLFQLHLYVGENTDKMLLPHFTREKVANVQIAATSLPGFGAGRLKDFATPVELREAILASCAAFPAAAAQTHKGTLYVDGGLSDFQPVIDEDTITVSPFYFSNSDIRPSRYVPLWWAFMPPNTEHTVDWLFQLGYEDCLTYLEKRKIADYLHGKHLAGDSSPLMQHHHHHRSSGPSHSLQAQGAVRVAWEQLKTFTKERMGLSPAHQSDHRKVSLRRFLGYDLHSLTNHYVSFTLDLCLLLLLLLVWKPLALCLIYAELLVRTALLSCVLLLKCTGVYALTQLLQSKQSAAVTSLKRSQAAAQGLLTSTLEEMSDCLVCVFSLSLALRFISGRPTPSVELRKHDRLAKHSLLYRVFRHII